MSDHTLTLPTRNGVERFDLLHPWGRVMAMKRAQKRGDTRTMHKVYRLCREATKCALKGGAS